MKRPHPSSSRRGTAMVLAIILAMAIVGLVAVIAWMAGVQSASASDLSKVDQAFFAAETGAHRVAWYCKNKTISSITSPLTGTVNGYSYSTSWSTYSGTTLAVVSKGSKGNTSYTLSWLVTPPGPVVAAYTVAGDFDNKNIIISGDVWAGGNYTNSGAGSISGNVTYGGTATNTGSVGGTVTQAAFSALDFTAMGTTLLASATTMSTSATYDFTLLGGTNKVIYVNGSVTNPTIIGSGTLYVNGSITYTNANATIGSSALPVNLVATGDVTFQKSTDMYGGLYAAGNWNRAQVNMNGVVYVGGIGSSNNGSSTFTLSSTGIPWFDPRLSGSGSTVTVFASFSGPLQ